VFERVLSDVSRDLPRRGETLDRPQGVNQGRAGESSDPWVGHQPSDVRVLFRIFVCSVFSLPLETTTSVMNSVRVKLTLWYTSVLVLVLVLFSVGVYVLMGNKLHDRLDRGLQTTMEGTVRLFSHEKAEGETDQDSAESAIRKYYCPRQARAVFDHNRSLLKEQTWGDVHAFLPAGVALDRDDLQFYTLSAAQTGVDDGLRTAVQRIRTSPQHAVFIVVCQQTEDASGDLKSLGGILGVAIPFVLILTAASGWFLARKSLAPVVIMSERARRIGAENLEERLPIINQRDELGNLAATLNELLARLHQAVTQQRQFMTDASHKLRTPVSVIRTAVEVTMEQSEREASEYREALAIVSEQARRLTGVVEEMSTLARRRRKTPCDIRRTN
jgi:HAMP domain-containing protein